LDHPYAPEVTEFFEHFKTQVMDDLNAEEASK
jgi:hypothetical protein